MRRSFDQGFDPVFVSPTDKQQAFLNRHNLNTDRPLDFYDAACTIERFVRARRQMSPTVRQERFLKERGKWKEGMTRGEAYDLIRVLLAGQKPLA